MTALEELLQHLTVEDRVNYVKAVDAVGAAFAAETGLDVAPDKISNLSTVREHVLSGGGYELNLAVSIEELKKDTSISNQLIAAEVEKAEISRITEDTRNMSASEKISYARERGLDRPREDTSASNMTLNEHHAVLAGLSPQQRINYARRHGL